MGKTRKGSEENSSDMSFPNVLIRLKDGTELDVVQNGTTYESGTVINKAKLTDENLQEIQIDGVTYFNMTLVSIYPWDEGTRFAIRELTDQEIENKDLKAQLQAADQSIAELTMIVSGLLM